jgi:phage terminase large subunit GpA-like protein
VSDAALLESRVAEAERQATDRFRPEPLVTRREWGEQNRLVGVSGKIPLRFDRTPYLIDIIDALEDPETEEVTVMKPTQAGATDGLLLTVLGYHIDQDPCPILVILPSIDEAEKWSKKKLAPIIERPPLAGRVSDPRSRDGANTILEKQFPGGWLGLVGSNSARGFRMVTVRIVAGDDVDGWAESAGSEGDQITLARRRAERSPDRQYLWISTPTHERSRIKKLYDQAERRGRFHVPCPQCGEYQVLRWGDRDTPYGIKWGRGNPETAYYVCAVNGCVFYDEEKHAVIPQGKYLTEDGEPVRDGSARSYGFHFSALSVTLAGSEWPKLVDEWLTVYPDPVARRGFVNTVLAEVYTESNEDISTSRLESRRENWRRPIEEGGREIDVPHGVGILSMSVDVQADWIEGAVWGWGTGEECWLVYHERIYGDPETAGTFATIEAIRQRKWLHESGREVLIWPVGVDARHKGPGVVYPYVRGKESEGVSAMLGYDTRAKHVLSRAERPNKYGVMPWTVQVDSFKSSLFERLKMKQPEPGLAAPGYIHLPVAFPMGADANFIQQFRAEKREEKRSAGRYRAKFVQIERRNEAIDLYVLGLAALHTLGPTVRSQLKSRADEWSKPPKPPSKSEQPEAAAAADGGSWANRF